MAQQTSLSMVRLVVVIAQTAFLGLPLLAGCSSTRAPATGGAGDVPFAVAEPGDACADIEPRGQAPVGLQMTSPPVYRLDAIPARPVAIGQLNVPLKRAWKYIVIHHSYTDSGSEKSFDDYHKNVRGWLGVGYHFVIGNGRGSGDGAIEVTFRWEDQIHGAHAGVEQYNQYGIGICLVGNFETGYPTGKQMASLVSLVNHLQEKCKIPTANILLHRNVKSTKCPGKNFPLYRFLSLLPH